MPLFSEIFYNIAPPERSRWTHKMKLKYIVPGVLLLIFLIIFPTFSYIIFSSKEEIATKSTAERLVNGSTFTAVNNDTNILSKKPDYENCFEKVMESISEKHCHFYSKYVNSANKSNSAFYGQIAKDLMTHKNNDTDVICRIRSQMIFPDVIKNCMKHEDLNTKSILYLYKDSISLKDINKNIFTLSNKKRACEISNDTSKIDSFSAVVFNNINASQMAEWSARANRTNQVWVYNIIHPDFQKLHVLQNDSDTGNSKTDASDIAYEQFNWTGSYKLMSNIPWVYKIPKLSNSQNSEVSNQSSKRTKVKVVVYENICNTPVKDVVNQLKKNDIDVVDLSCCHELIGSKIKTDCINIRKDFLKNNTHQFVLLIDYLICPEYPGPITDIVDHKSTPVVLEDNKDLFDRIFPAGSVYYLPSLNETSINKFIQDIKDETSNLHYKKYDLRERTFFFNRLCSFLHANPTQVSTPADYEWIEDNHKCHGPYHMQL